MIKVGIVIGSTRPGRTGETVARWIHDLAVKRGDAEYELVDLKDFALPHLDEELPAALGQYANRHTKAWSDRIAEFDAYVFVTPEYNHSFPGALKDAIDFLFAEWHDKAAAVVGYGVNGGVRAAEHLRQVLGMVKVADVQLSVALPLEEVAAPAEKYAQQAGQMLDQLVSWGAALRTIRV